MKAFAVAAPRHPSLAPRIVVAGLCLPFLIVLAPLTAFAVASDLLEP